jgi:ADP-dependent NAD(P)H-hydrate dehydratase / NAD(P)H-hydrate epimerase
MNNEAALLNVNQMSLADSLTIAAGTSAFDLMKKAGDCVAQVIIHRWAIQPVVVLCGPGNNGGDGFVVAQTLRSAGWPVRLAFIGNYDDLVNEAAAHAALWKGPIEALCPAILEGASIVVDAIFGAGLTREVIGAAKDTLHAAAAKNLIIVAIDVPTGVVGNTGENLGAAQATITVTFFRKKPGHLLQPGRHFCGEVIVKDIGISDQVFADIVPNTFENQPCLWRFALRTINEQDNKYHRGHVLISGGYPMTGAARLAAHAAARIGAGLTTIAIPEIAFCAYAAGLMSTILKPLKRVSEFEQLLSDSRFTSFLIGPGAGVSEDTRTICLKMLATGKPTVIDADAISSFHDDPTLLFNAINGPCVLTPHEGEFKRVFSSYGDKLQRARDAATQSGAVVILKGSDTVIATPDGRAAINSNAPKSLATAGSGDVLSGIILGLLGQGMNPFLASCAAVWIHGAAAQSFGPGLIADDLPDLLPRAVQSIDALIYINNQRNAAV